METAFRNLKSELAIQSLRVYDWEGRLKLLGLLALAYAFLMDLMRQEERRARDWLIDYACGRTGRHLQEVELPFTRLRIALSKPFPVADVAPRGLAPLSKHAPLACHRLCCPNLRLGRVLLSCFVPRKQATSKNNRSM